MNVLVRPYDSVMAIDIDRLTQDLRAGAAFLLDGPEPITPFEWGMSRAWLILASAIDDGEYDLDPRSRTIADLDPAWDRDDDGRAGEPA